MFVVRTLRKWNGSRRSGTAIVELAVTLPLILSVLIGIINSGQIFWVREIVMSASREGARAYMTRIPNSAKARQTAEKFLGQYFSSTTHPSFVAGNLGDITVTTNPATDDVIQEQRQVIVQVPIGDVLLTGNYLNIWDETKLIEGNSTFRQGQQ